MRRRTVNDADRERKKIGFIIGFLTALSVFGVICAVLLIVLIVS